jgi:hypothetical protein
MLRKLGICSLVHRVSRLNTTFDTDSKNLKFGLELTGKSETKMLYQPNKSGASNFGLQFSGVV